jgi:septal ring factor EnvC (AmiA/AmiB activator)
VGSSTSHNPIGLHGLLRGKLYFTFTITLLLQEKEKYSQMAAKWQKELQELQSQAQEDNLTRVRLQMELDSKDSEIEQLQGKLASLNSETASLSSGGAENDDELMGQGKRPQV